MKKQISTNKKNLFKKIFIKICRILGYEIIDQNNLFLPSSEKFFNEELNVAGKKSINLPLGEIKILIPIKSLDIIIKTCTSINLVNQSKERIFKEKKSEYTFRSINSLIKSINFAKENMKNISFKIHLIDHNSDLKDLEIIKKN